MVTQCLNYLFILQLIMQSRNLSWKESLKISAYNLKFKTMAYIDQYTPTQILTNFQNLFLLGQKFSANPDNHKLVNQLIYKKFSTTIWITYRSEFKQIRGKDEQTYVTDAGWGCMIRAGQMLIAQILKRHLKLEQKEQLIEIIKLFNDSQTQAMFSLGNIIKKATKQYQIYAGVWFNPSQIMFVINDIFNEYPQNLYSKTLSLIIMNNSTLIFDQILKKMIDKQQLCDCKKKLVVCYKCNKKEKAVCVMVLTRIGLNKPEIQYLRCLNKIIQCPYFQGFIGGKPQKALYFLGKQSTNRYIYLDPHIVQPAVEMKNTLKQKQSYFCSNFRSCKNVDIDPSMGLSFYLQSLQDLDEFYKWMLDLKTSGDQDFFLFMSIQTPDFMKAQYQDENRLVQIMSDDQQDANSNSNKSQSKV